MVVADRRDGIEAGSREAETAAARPENGAPANAGREHDAAVGASRESDVPEDTRADDADDNAGATRAGYVALAGRPNVGKSALLNALTGEKLSIVTPRAQTTRERVMGIHTTTRAQLVFVDTPGLLDPRYLLQESMLESALIAVREADVALLLLDATRPQEVPSEPALRLLHGRAGALVVAVNKVDAADGAHVERLVAWSRAELGVDALRISARTGEGIEELREVLIAALPVSSFLYPPDELAVQPVRFFVAEFVRETIFEEYEQEVPYSTVVRVEEFRESEQPLYIRATIFVERESQKAIIIGQRGTAIKRLGQRARVKIEGFLGGRVYLDLWVKILPGWRKKRTALRHLGYRLPSGEPRA